MTDRDGGRGFSSISDGRSESIDRSNTADLKLAIQLKELDLRVKQQEHDTAAACQAV